MLALYLALDNSTTIYMPGLYWYSSQTSSALITQNTVSDEETRLHNADPGHTYNTDATGGTAWEYGYADLYPHIGDGATIIYRH